MTDAPRSRIDIPELRFPEGPRWHDGALWFSDQIGNAVRRLEPDGTVQVIAELPNPSGLGFLPDGSPLAASMRTCLLSRIRPDGSTETFAELGSFGVALNDMFVDGEGRAYVDVYGDDRETGDLLLVTDGSVQVAARGLRYPNGIAITPDGSTLLVAETFGARITAFDVAADGSLANRRVWAQLPGRAPDGLCLDTAGAIWVASYLTGEFLRVGSDSEVTDLLTVPGRWAMACALGGADNTTLYLCSADTDRRRYFAGDAVGYLEQVDVAVAGVGRP